MAQVDATGEMLVGRYRLGKRVGGGGMGAVYEAQDERVGRRVAVKVLHPQLAKEGQHVIRFLREAKAAASLRHPHIVQVLDVSGEGDETPFLVMEFLEGRSLARMIKDGGRLAPGRVARLGRQLLAALAAAHRAGIVHRDMKPGNVIVQTGYDGREIAKIVDFGIAKLMDTLSYTRLTATGELLGTPAYMSPEQLTGGRIDGRTDLYGVGAIMYAAIAGEPAPGRGSLPEIAQRALIGDHLPLVERVEIHPGLSAAIECALRVDPLERYFEPAEMSDALAPFEDPTGALVAPEHRSPVPTRESPSMRPPPASGTDATLSTKSQRPPPRASAREVPITSERPPPRASAREVPITSERPPPRASDRSVPITSERPPSRPLKGPVSHRPPARAIEMPVARSAPPRATDEERSPAGASTAAKTRKGLMLAILAFGGALLGAAAVVAVAVFSSRGETPDGFEPPPSVPVAVPMAVVPSPSTEPSAVDPMQPSDPSLPMAADLQTPTTESGADAAADVDVGAAVAEDEEPRRRSRRRRRRRPRPRPDDALPGSSDAPIYTIPADRIPSTDMTE